MSYIPYTKNPSGIAFFGSSTSDSLLRSDSRLSFDSNSGRLLISGVAVSTSGHQHQPSDITNFASSVSGLIPVKGISAGTGIVLSSNSGIFTINVSGNFGLTGEEVDDRVSGLLIGNSGISLTYDDLNNRLFISTSGLQPSGNYSLVGHSHQISDINSLQLELNNKAPILHAHGVIDPFGAIGTSFVIAPSSVGGPVVFNAAGGGVGRGQFGSEVGTVCQGNDFRLSNARNPTDHIHGNITNAGTIGSVSGLLIVTGNSGILTISSGINSSLINNFNSSVSGLVSGIYAPLNNPTLTGIPLSPTAPSGTNTNQIASTAFVRNELSSLVDAAPSTLDTLNELAAALGDDANFSTTVTNLIAGKVSKTGDTMTGNLYGPSGYFTNLFANNIPVSVSGHSHLSSDIIDFSNEIGRTVNTVVVDGSYINTVYDSGANTFTISATGLQPSGNYSLIGHSHIINDVSGLQVALDSKQPSGIYASGIHTHISSDITNFDSSVSGLLPLNIATGIGASGNLARWTSNNTISSGLIYDDLSAVYITKPDNTGILQVSGTSAIANIFSNKGTSAVSALRLGHDTSNTSFITWYSEAHILSILRSSLLYSAPSGMAFIAGTTSINNPALYINSNRYIGIGRYTPAFQLDVIGTGNFSQNLLVNNIPVSVSGHTHTSSNITNFNSSVSGLLPTVSGSGYINSSFVNNIYTLSATGLQPSGNYSVVGHSHVSSDITNFNTSVNNLVSGVYAPLDSPVLTGIPLTPTAISGTNTNQIASTAFVRTEISNLVNSAPSTLDTLNELAAALGNDANFSTTVTNSLAGKANLSGATFTGAISGPSGDFTTLRQNGIDVSISGHTHVSLDIIDFNTSVSGLLPKISNSGDNRILTSTGSTVGINAENNLTFDGSLLNVSGNFVAQAGTINSLNFNNIGDPAIAIQQLTWNNSEGSLQLGLSNNYAMFIGGELHYRVRNNTGSTLLAGTAVYATGLTPGGNNRIEIAPKAADGSIREVRFMGLMTEDCNSGFNGYTTHFGYIRGLDTRGDASANGTTNKLWTDGEPSWAEGDILYVHPTAAGKLTKIEPKHSISVAIILNRHQQQGKLFVRPISYGHLGDNHDVDISGATNGQFLQYNSSTDYWLPSSSGNFTSLSVGGIAVSVSGHTHTSSDITNFNSSVSGLFPANLITGVGTSGYLSRWNGANSLTSGVIFDNGTNVGIGTTNPSGALHIERTVANNSYLLLSSPSNIVKTHIGVGNNDSVPFLASTNNIQLASGNYGWGFFDRATDGNLRLARRTGSTSWTDTLHINRNNGNIGVGTTTPSGQLHVVGTGLFTAIDINNSAIAGQGSLTVNGGIVTQGSFVRSSIFGIYGDNNTRLYKPNGSTLGYEVSSSGFSHSFGFNNLGNHNPWMSINTTGVGIGTSTPSSQLHVVGSGLFSGDVTASGSFIGGSGTATLPSFEFIGDLDTGLFSPLADTFAISTSGVERLRVNNIGRIGIGNSNPQYALDVSGSGNFLNGLAISGVPIAEVIDDEVAGLLVAGSGISLNYNDSANTLTVDTNVSTSLVAGSGISLVYNVTTDELSINTSATYAPISSPTFSGTSAFANATFASSTMPVVSVTSTSSTEAAILQIRGRTSDGAGFIYFTNNAGSSNNGFLTGFNGTLQIYGGGYSGPLTIGNAGLLNSQPTYDTTAAGSTVVVTSAGDIRRTSSSIKYKKDIEDLDPNLVSNAVDNLRPVWYRTKNPVGDDKSNWSQIGLIAEEAALVEPRIVRYRTVEVQTSGEMRTEIPLQNPEPEDIDYGRLSVLLLAEIKQLKNRISQLESQVNNS